jgi:hypothetical protein
MMVRALTSEPVWPHSVGPDAGRWTQLGPARGAGTGYGSSSLIKARVA